LHSASARIDDLRIEMVFPYYGAVLGLDALVRYTRTHHFRQAVNVDGIQPHHLFDLRTHRFGPRLRAQNSDAHRARGRIEALPHELFGDREQIRRRHHDDVGLEVADQLNLLLCLATGHRHDGAPQALRAVVRTKTACAQAVAVGDVHDIAGLAARCTNRARHELRPGVDILLRVADDCGLASRAAGCMYAHDLLARHGKHAERIVRAQV